jgi:hypothetical protein
MTVPNQPASGVISGGPLEKAQWCLRRVQRACNLYQFLYHFFRWTIPTLSTILAALVTMYGVQQVTPSQPVALIALSIAVSVLTILNTTISPAKEFARFVSIRSKFQRFVDGYDLERQLLELRLAAKKDEEQKKRARLNWEIRKRNEVTDLIQEWSIGVENQPARPAGRPQEREVN